METRQHPSHDSPPLKPGAPRDDDPASDAVSALWFRNAADTPVPGPQYRAELLAAWKSGRSHPAQLQQVIVLVHLEATSHSPDDALQQLVTLGRRPGAVGLAARQLRAVLVGSAGSVATLADPSPADA